MKEAFIQFIIQRLKEAEQTLKAQFFEPHPFPVARFFTLDELLPQDLAHHLYQAFPSPKQMRTLSKYGEVKLKYFHLKQAKPLLQDINAAIQDPRVIALVEGITGIKNQVPDPSPFAGGISMLLKGHYLNPHLDNSHDVDKKLYRTLNLLYYVSPNWQASYGGNFELWDTSISQRLVVPNLFNRLLVMETHQSSWHAVNPVLCKAPRCCIYNYYFSKDSPEPVDYFFNSNTFRARPEQKFLRTLGFLKRLL